MFKFISWAIALGSGTSGGTLAPLLTIGGATGMLLKSVVLYIFPSSGVTLPLAALVGMAARFAGASRAFLTSIIFALETTAQSNALLPLLATCGASYIISFFLMGSSIMTEKISRRGVMTPDSYEADLLEKISVEQVMEKNGLIISEDNSIGEVLAWLDKEPDDSSNFFIVTNDKGEYKGIVSSSTLFSSNHEHGTLVGSFIKRKYISVYINDSLRTAVEVMAKENIDVLPVMAKTNDNIIGLLSYKDIIASYKHGIEDHTKKRPDIIVRRRGLKLLVRGQRIVNRFTNKKEL